MNALKDWKIDSQAQTVCCDTSSLNTGRLNGTFINIEQSLKKQLLFFACRHHMLELIIGAVFTASSKVIFKKLNIPTSFLDKDPEFWKENDDF